MSASSPTIYLIDGYNLLHASGVFGGPPGPNAFAQARRALLDALAELLAEREAARTTVIFDAADAPRGLPAAGRHRGIYVRFARDHADADDLIEQLIVEHRDPRRLTVVSGDHRLHRAARQRGATAIDSDVWLREMKRRQETDATSGAAKPADAPSPADVEFWLRQFGGTVEENPPSGPVPFHFPPGYGDDIDEP